MIMPAIFVAAVLIYHTGMWDKTVKSHLPRHTENIQTAGSGSFGGDGYRAYFVLNTYAGTPEDDQAIEAYASKNFLDMTRANSAYLSLNVYFYFVPREHYDPIDDAVSRERAVATFLHSNTDTSATMERVSP